MAIDRNRHAARFLRMIAEKEQRLAFSANAIFRSQGFQVSRAYRKGSRIDAEEVAKSFEARWIRTLAAHYLITAKDFSALTREEIGQEAQRETPSFNDLIEEFIAAEALRKAKIINQTTIESIKRIIAQGISEGTGSEQIARNIRKQVAEIDTVHRSRAIARTETHNAATFSSQATAEASGIEFENREWVTSIDGRERDDHRDADGQKRKINEKFLVGGEFLDRPSTGSASNAINCRCSIIYHPVIE